jgi:hypothetical protein
LIRSFSLFPKKANRITVSGNPETTSNKPLVMGNKYLEIAATDNVKRVQQRLGSRAVYSRPEGGPTIHQQLGPDEIAIIEAQDTFFLASVSETGWPYVQHRGGPKAFDWNCSQYIVPRFSEDEVRDLLQPLKQRIEELETRIRNQESMTGNPSVTE